MRPVIAFLIWVVLIGGLTAYMHARERVAAGRVVDFQAARGNFALELTTTFDLEPDPFALQSDDGSGPAAIVVRINGKDVLRRSDRVQRGTQIVVEPVSHLAQGQNEIYVEASAPLDSAGRSLAVRVRLMEDGRQVADRTFWSEEGARVAGVFSVNVEGVEPADVNHHGH